MQKLSPQSEIPEVSQGVMQGLAHDLQHDPSFADRAFNRANNDQHAIVVQAVVEAHKFAEGDMHAQEGFVKGAVFALSALDRQVSTLRLQELFSQDMTDEADIPLFDMDETAA